MIFNASRLTCRMAAAVTCLLPVMASANGLGFAEAQQAALDQSRQLVAQDALARSARELAVAAGERPDPMLSLGVDNLPVSGSDRFSLSRDFMTMRRIGLSQELTRTDKLRLRQERQLREADIADAGKAMAQSETLRGVGKAWLSAYSLQQRHGLLAELRDQARQQQIAAEAGYRGGRTTQTDALAAGSEVLMLDDQLQVLARQETQARLTLARWVGTDASQQPLDGMPDFAHSHFDSGDLGDHLRQHPDLLMQASRIRLAETEASLAEAGKQADWTAELSYAQRGAAYSDMVSVGVSVPLQWDQRRRQNREIAARQAQAEAARAEQDDMLRAHVAEVQALLADWQSGLSRLQRYRERLIPLAEARVRAALAAYRGGRGSLSDALASRRLLLDTRLQALELEQQTALTWADLEFLLPPATRSTP